MTEGTRGTVDLLHDLEDRLERAADEVGRITEVAMYPENIRLRGKGEGIRLALSYLQETLRDAAQSGRP